jgi:hypothetical protein
MPTSFDSPKPLDAAPPACTNSRVTKAKPTRKKASGSSPKATMTIGESRLGGRTVRFGAVTVIVGKLAPDEETRNIRQGQLALKRASKTLVTPGVTMVQKKTVPFFHADPKVPGRVIRVLNGKKASGTFDENGVFKTIAR